MEDSKENRSSKQHRTRTEEDIVCPVCSRSLGTFASRKRKIIDSDGVVRSVSAYSETSLCWGGLAGVFRHPLYRQRFVVKQLIDNIKIYDNGSISVKFKFTVELCRLCEYIQDNAHSEAV